MGYIVSVADSCHMLSVVCNLCRFTHVFVFTASVVRWGQGSVWTMQRPTSQYRSPLNPQVWTSENSKQGV